LNLIVTSLNSNVFSDKNFCSQLGEIKSIITNINKKGQAQETLLDVYGMIVEQSQKFQPEAWQ